MKHKIDAMVDCVFKALLGQEHNKNLLIDFLNAVIQPLHPIKGVTLLNPYNEKGFLSDKLSVVDVKAKDDQEQTYQVEVQLCTPGYLSQRMLYWYILELIEEWPIRPSC